MAKWKENAQKMAKENAQNGSQPTNILVLLYINNAELGREENKWRPTTCSVQVISDLFCYIISKQDYNIIYNQPKKSNGMHSKKSQWLQTKRNEKKNGKIPTTAENRISVNNGDTDFIPCCS